MTLRSRQRGQLMLIILGTLFLGSGVATGVFTSGKTIKSMRKEVKSLQIEDPRREQVLATLDRWEAIAQPAGEGYGRYGESLLELIRRQDSSQAEFEEVLDRQRGELRSAEDRLLPLRDELRALLDEKEWNQLFRRG